MTVLIPSWQARWQRRWNNGLMMHVLRKSAHALFVSQSLAGYLIRGTVAVALIFWAVSYYREHPWWGLMAVALSMVAMRGCPTCWIGGLFDIFRARRCERCSTGRQLDR